MMKLAVLSIAILGAAPAFAGGPVIVADDAVVAAPAPMRAPAPSGDWGGFYGGAQLGYGSVNGNATVENALDFGGDGLIGGIHAGYRMDWGTFVGGAELAYDLTNIEIGNGATGSFDNMASLKLMGGVDFGQWLAYGTVGMSRVGADFSDTLAGNDTLEGRFAGLGAEYALSEQLSVGGEVLQHSLSNDAADFDMTTVQARVNFRF
ncbi:outer membrane protein [Paragemmobacter straminiformis]|uniref:Outer membrane beta-barrel protein n=1 Tax=Paragemmobacter straminiformis TaxID=2045119 RepID=A0A842I9B1_9RHOB|nr:outer membrane beta-barrel protein [Gemmobacter straminiformis]MBC2835578.1 outer membrane beta-barrel protein [Gemmobacter straminiformis]